MRRVPLTTVPRPLGRHQFDLEVAVGRIAACGEHLERCGDIERVESVEQHDLRVHTVIVGKSRAANSGQIATYRRDIASAEVSWPMHTVAVLALPDTIAFDLATPVETFGRVQLPTGAPGYRVLVCGPEPVVTAGPFRIGTDHGVEALAEADTIVVPGRNDVAVDTPDEVLAALRPPSHAECASRRSARVRSPSPTPDCSTESGRRHTGWPPTCSARAIPPCTWIPTFSTSTRARS